LQGAFKVLVDQHERTSHKKRVRRFAEARHLTRAFAKAHVLFGKNSSAEAFAGTLNTSFRVQAIPFDFAGCFCRDI